MKKPNLWSCVKLYGRDLWCLCTVLRCFVTHRIDLGAIEAWVRQVNLGETGFLSSRYSQQRPSQYRQWILKSYPARQPLVFILGDTERNAFSRLFHGSSNDLSLMHTGVKMYHGVKNSLEADVFAVLYMRYVAYLFSESLLFKQI